MSRIAPTLMCVLALALSAVPAAAQRGEVYCQITDITADQLSNGVRVTISADGEMQWEEDSKLEGQAVRRVRIFIYNAKSMLGSAFVPIEKYPVSHVEISIPYWAREGVGLQIDIVNYLPHRTGEGFLRENRYSLDFSPGEDRSSVSVLWTSDRFPPPPPPTTPEDLPSELDVTTEEGLLTIRAVNAKIQDVASAIAAEAGLAITAPAENDLRVSLYLHSVSSTRALHAIAVGSGLCAHRHPDGVWVLATPGASGYVASSTRTIALRYLQASDALDLLPNFLLAYLRADAEANTVSVTGPEWMLERVAEDLAELDTPAPEVVIEVVAVEYTSGDALVRALNLDWSAGNLAAGLDSLTGGLRFLWLESLPRGWSLLLDDLEVDTATKLRSRATVRVLNGRVAAVRAGEERYVILERLAAWSRAELERVDTGASLWVQPLVGEGDEVYMRLAPSVHTLVGKDLRSGLPVVAMRTAEGYVRVRDGETIAVAGFHSYEHSREDRAIPILGSLPLVGPLFRAVDRSQARSHLAFFVTPRVVRRHPPGKEERTHG